MIFWLEIAVDYPRRNYMGVSNNQGPQKKTPIYWDPHYKDAYSQTNMEPEKDPLKEDSSL